MKPKLAHPLVVDRVSVVDLSDFLSGTAQSKARVAKAIAEACESIGFFYLRGHGVPQAKIDATFDAARFFFSLPDEARLRDDLICTPRQNRGYMPLKSRHYPGTGAPDLMEAFKVQEPYPPDDPDIAAGNRGQFLNKWPPGHPQFQRTVLDYFNEMTGLSHHLLRGFALALALEETYFLEFFRKPMTQLSLIHYPPQPPGAPGDEYGVRPHADATAFTILYQDDVGGLEVQNRDGAWIAVPPLPGTYVINIGNWMARWTNDRFASTMHRVFNRTGRERYSLPFFGIPDFDAVVACVPTCHGTGNPAKYPPIHVGDAINLKNSIDWVDRKAPA